MSFLASKPLKDSNNETWRVATDGKNSVFQKLVPASSNDPIKKSFATWGGQVPPEINVQAHDLSEEDFTMVG